MKKIAITILFSLAAAAVYAQTANDAYMFSENQYEGTARTMAMGNAFTALGGDLGSLNINPAGSAVAKYSQITITPSWSFSANTAQGNPLPGTDSRPGYFQNKVTSRTNEFNISNIGYTFYWDSGRKSGLKNITFGMVSNETNSWNGKIHTYGTNSETSFMSELAHFASPFIDPATNQEIPGIPVSELAAEDAFYSSIPWKYVVGYQSGMISPFDGFEDMYAGACDTVIYDPDKKLYEVFLSHPIRQDFKHNVIGNKEDFVFNLGANISDFIYVGANLGLTYISYNESWSFMEEAINLNDFGIPIDGGETIYFHNMQYDYNYNVEGSGIYGKFGVLVTPGYGLRFGAAIQTPTTTTMEETWTEDGAVKFSSGKYTAYSPYGTGGYTYYSPMRANFGFAYTYGKFGLISVDYEVTDYSQMRYDTNNGDRKHFTDVNNEIKERYGVSHMLRAGLEVKPLPELAIRAGYNLTTSGEKIDSWGNAISQNTQSASFGLGYSSKGPFFADAAVQTKFLNKQYFRPYQDYIDGVLSPEIVSHRSLWKAVLTLGWRF